MTQVAVTVTRPHLSPDHSMTVIRLLLEVLGIHGFCETRPATVAIKFVEGREERFTGNDVHVDTWLIMIPIRIIKRTLGTVLLRNLKWFPRKARYRVSICCVFGHATPSLTRSTYRASNLIVWIVEWMQK